MDQCSSVLYLTEERRGEELVPTCFTRASTRNHSQATGTAVWQQSHLLLFSSCSLPDGFLTITTRSHKVCVTVLPTNTITISALKILILWLLLALRLKLVLYFAVLILIGVYVSVNVLRKPHNYQAFFFFLDQDNTNFFFKLIIKMVTCKSGV